MTIAEIALWSASLGVFAVCLVAGLLNALVTRTMTGVQSGIFIFAAGLFVATCSGLLVTFAPAMPPNVVQILTLATGPIAAGAGVWGLMQFLRAHQHDQFVQRGMVVIGIVCGASLSGLFWPKYSQALEWTALVVSLCALASFWLVLRSALLGDRFAWPIAAATAAMVFGVVGLYAVALQVIANNTVLQAVAAVCVVGYLVGCLVAVWRRNSEFLRMRRAMSMHREKDLLTQLWTGAALIRQVEQTIARARRNRQETAIFCVEIFNAPQLRQELGNNALEQVIYSIAARVRQSVGASTEVGRYDDTSFVVIVESVKRPSMLRTIGLRLAMAVCKPYMLNPYSTSPREFRADMGVGIARIPATRDPRGGWASRSSRTHKPSVADTSFLSDSAGLSQESMHDASKLAKKARLFNSRVAIMDAYSRKAMAVEEVELP